MIPLEPRALPRPAGPAASEEFLRERLRSREESLALRALPHREAAALVDFTSNDYLGVVRSGVLARALAARAGDGCALASGSTGSRLLSGNSPLAEETEALVAAYHRAPAGLLFGSGYNANLGLLAAVPQDGDTILYDEQVHASIHDGIRLSHARSFPCRHNDLEHLARRLSSTAGRVFVVVESVYSMDGDEAALAPLADLCAERGALLIVDEAHATGLYGEGGRGLAAAAGCEEKIFARVHTFGKALGAHGAIVLGSHLLREYLINFARSFIYSTAPPPHALHAIVESYALLPRLEQERSRLWSNIAHFQKRRDETERVSFVAGGGAIQGVFADGNAAARRLSERLREGGLDARPILSPTVRRGRERLRITLHSQNSTAEIDALFALLEPA